MALVHTTPGRSFLAVVAAAPAVAAAVEAHVHTSVPARTVGPADTCRSFAAAAAAAVVAPAVADTAVGLPAYTDNMDYLPPLLAVVLDHAAVEAQLNIYARPDHLAAAVGAAAAGTIAVAFAFPDATAVLAAASFPAAASSHAAFVSLA